MITSRYDPYDPTVESISKLVNCKGGGGSSSGAVSYPTYMETMHSTWLTELSAFITIATTGGSPFTAEVAYNPSTRISTMDTAVGTFKTAVDALDYDGDWIAAIAVAKTKLDTDIFDDAYIDVATGVLDTAVATLNTKNIAGTNVMDAAVSAFGTKITTGTNVMDVAISSLDTKVGAAATAMAAAITTFNNAINALDEETDWEAKIDAAVAKLDAAVFDDTYIDADIAAYTAILNANLVDTDLPRFQTGMRDVNAVYSSAFVMGEAEIYAKQARDIAKYTSELRLSFNNLRNTAIMEGTKNMLDNLIKGTDFKKAVAQYTIETSKINVELEQVVAQDTIETEKSGLGLEQGVVQNTIETEKIGLDVDRAITQATIETERIGIEAKLKFDFQRSEGIIKCAQSMLDNILKQVELNQSLSHQTIEASRIGIVALKEQADQDFNIIDLDARWDMDVYQYGANLLGGISGGTVKAGGDAGMSKGQSALGGALSGAAMGAQIGGGNPWAIGAGALIGGIGGLLG